MPADLISNTDLHSDLILLLNPGKHSTLAKKVEKIQSQPRLLSFIYCKTEMSVSVVTQFLTPK